MATGSIQPTVASSSQAIRVLETIKAGGGCDVLIHLGRNEHRSSNVQIAFLVSQMNVNDSFFDIQNSILPEVFVRGKAVPQTLA